MAANDGLSEEQYGEWTMQSGFGELRQILYWRWDPIGVDNAFPITADEYDSYVEGLLSRLWRGIQPAAIADCLRQAERESMGSGYTAEAELLALGQRIADWHENSIDLWMRRRDSTP